MPEPLVIVTRPLPAARRFVEALGRARRAPVPAIISPALAIRPRPVALAVRPAGLVLTSENGAARAVALGLAGLPAWCVGPRTAATARAAGLDARVAGPDADGLVARLLAERPAGPLLHLRGEHARGDVAARLRAGGLEADEAVAYAQDALGPTPEAREALDGAAPVLLPLFSPRSAAVVASWPARAPLHVLAISPAAALPGAASLTVAGAPDGPAMVRATLRRLAALTAPRLEGGGGPG